MMKIKNTRFKNSIKNKKICFLYLHKISLFSIFSKSFSRIFSNSELFNDREVFTFYYSLLIDCSMLLHCNRMTCGITSHTIMSAHYRVHQ